MQSLIQINEVFMGLVQQSWVGNQINSIFPGQEKSHGEFSFSFMENEHPWKCPKPGGGGTWGHGLVEVALGDMD